MTTLKEGPYQQGTSDGLLDLYKGNFKGAKEDIQSRLAEEKRAAESEKPAPKEPKLPAIESEPRPS